MGIKAPSHASTVALALEKSVTMKVTLEKDLNLRTRLKISYIFRLFSFQLFSQLLWQNKLIQDRLSQEITGLDAFVSNKFWAG